MLGVELDAKRAKELFDTKVISEQEYTNKTQLYQTKLAAVAAAQAAMEQAQLNLDYTKIVSPLDGIAGQQQAQIGDLVGTGANIGFDDGLPDRSDLVLFADQRTKLLGVCRSFEGNDGGAGGQTSGERRTHPGGWQRLFA